MAYRLLIADDEALLTELLCEHFQGCGYQTFSAASSEEVLERLSLRPDLILLDISMPGMDGLELCRMIRSGAGAHLARTILQTAAGRSIQTRGAREENCQVLRDSKMPAALLEIGYMTCPEELAWLQTPDCQSRMAQAIAEGILTVLSSAA